jgi:phosphoglycerate kinase
MINTLDKANFTDKKVLVRVDFNVPLDSDRKITDDNRIEMSLPTINKIIDDHGIPILMSHLGRPDGKINLKYSLKPVADLLHNKFGYNVIFIDDCISPDAKTIIDKAKVGDIVLLENLRFYPEEEKNDVDFAQKLAQLADVYVNDAFGTAHRAHASTAAVAGFFKEKYAGKLMIDEIEYLGKAVNNPIRPFTAILGGAKISGKIDVIKNLMTKCDNILIGGGMMFTFYKAMGYEIGKSLLEVDKMDLAKSIIDEAKAKNINLFLPVDFVSAAKFENNSETKICKLGEINSEWLGMDIGPKTIELFKNIILSSKTIVWNGPMGVFEMPNFSIGTFEIANALAEATSKGAITIVGGGDSAAAINQMKFESKITHVSTGGGASLEYLEGKELPGVKALEM